MTFGEKLKSLRIEAGMTQKELAAITHFDQGTISGWEHNKYSASIEALAVLADSLQCTIDYLICRESEEGNIQIHYTGYVPDDEELALLFNYKKLNAAQKHTVNSVISTFLHN